MALAGAVEDLSEVQMMRKQKPVAPATKYIQQVHKTDNGELVVLVRRDNRNAHLAIVCKVCKTVWEVVVPIFGNVTAAIPDEWVDSK